MTDNAGESHLSHLREMVENHVRLKSHLNLLAIIVSRINGEKVSEFLRERHFHFQFVCLAQGTSGSELMDMLGLGSVDNSLILSLAPHFRTKPLLSELSQEFKLHKSGKGIAFTLPLSGISVPILLSMDPGIHGEWKIHMENEVDKMGGATHDVIVAVINKGSSEEVVEAAKSAGARGGTVIHARRAGAEEAIKFLGASVQTEKEIVAILTKRETKHAIMKAINDAFGAKTPARGIVISLPVDNVIGLEE